MRIDVLLGEARTAPADVADRVVIVIDVLRAATTVATALSNGARAIVPFETVDDTRRALRAYEQPMADMTTAAFPLTAGERGMVRIAGFDLGNSPLEYTRDVVLDKPIFFTTTNGTAALVAMQHARAQFFAAFVNATATVSAVATRLDEAPELAGVTIVCAGTDGTIALEDVVCAGRLVRGLVAARPELTLADSARIAMLAERPYVDNVARLAQDATHAHSLVAAGFGADVAHCFVADSVPVAVRFSYGVLTRADLDIAPPEYVNAVSDASATVN